MVKKHGFRLKGRIFMTVGEKIKKRREELGYTPQELADKLEMPFYMLSMIERGKSELGISKVPALCNSLKISVNYLLNLPTEDTKVVRKILLFAIQLLKCEDSVLLDENYLAGLVAPELL